MDDVDAAGLQHGRRLVGLDAFRGAVLAVMVLTPVTGEVGSYPLLGHAPWNGFTVADAILPAFLVASGASLSLLLRPPVTAATRLRLVRRTLALLVLGVVYNAWGQSWDLSAVRLTGVLQLIGIAGALAGTVVLLTRRSTSATWPLVGAALALPLIHGLWLVRAGRDCTADGAACSPYTPLDVALIGEGHLYAGGSAGYDPEGVVMAVVATALVLVGVVIGERLRTDRSWRTVVLVLAGAVALIALGVALDPVQPVNKRLQTPAFTALAGGIGALGLILSVGVIDLPVPGLRGDGAGRDRLEAIVDGVRRVVAHPFETLGRNALVVFFTERAVLTALAQTPVRTDGGAHPLRDVLLGGALGVEGVRVHLAYTAAVLLIVLAVTYAMRLLRWRIAL